MDNRAVLLLELESWRCRLTDGRSDSGLANFRGVVLAEVERIMHVGACALFDAGGTETIRTEKPGTMACTRCLRPAGVLRASDRACAICAVQSSKHDDTWGEGAAESLGGAEPMAFEEDLVAQRDAAVAGEEAVRGVLDEVREMLGLEPGQSLLNVLEERLGAVR